MEKIIMIKYGELTTKKGNRDLFVNTLYKNVSKKLKGLNCKIKKQRSRMYIIGENINVISSKLKEVFGIHEIDIVYKLDSKDIDIIKESVIKIFKNHNFKKFKVSTNRADKLYPINSMEVSKIIGGVLLKNYQDLEVNVNNPDFIIKIEIREEGAFIYSEKIKGIGGYPVGVQGKALAMLSGGIDSPVAVYLALKRGIHVDCVYFDSPPHTSRDALNKVKKLVEILKKYDDSIKLYIVPFTKMQEEIYKNRASNYMITIMRRMMYRIICEFANSNDYKVIINGESIGQVASQTLSSINIINSVTNIPIIRPVACLDKIEIMDIARKIGTYDTSILPYEDCCTIFLPQHPVINPKNSIVNDIESRFDYKNIIDEVIQNIFIEELDNIGIDLL